MPYFLEIIYFMNLLKSNIFKIIYKVMVKMEITYNYNWLIGDDLSAPKAYFVRAVLIENSAKRK